MSGVFDSVIGAMRKSAGDGVICTPAELKSNQFGFPLQHFAQQYLFGATGLRVGICNSISGMPQSCKSPLLFDLLGHTAGAPEDGGLGGLGVLYEMEDKISPELLSSLLSRHGQTAMDHTTVVKAETINVAMKLFSKFIANCKSQKVYDIPILVGFDSIGGAATQDVTDKILSEGAVGKGFYDKAHFMKHFCENLGAVVQDLPVVIVCINQEKEKVEAAFGPKTKDMMKVTGGTSQVYKDGFMVHATYNLIKGPNPGKAITLRTIKASFSDERSIAVDFLWNNAGKSVENAYDHRFEWAAASARLIASPTKDGLSAIHDICDVRVAGDSGLVTCPTFGLKSVKAEEFEAALMSAENTKVREQLYTFLKIDRLKDMKAYTEYIANGHKLKDDAPEQEAAEAKPKKKASKPKAAPAEQPADAATAEEAEA